MRGAPVLALALVALAVTGCGGGGGDRPATAAPAGSGPAIRIGTKNFTEQYILGELYAQALRAKGFRVALKSDVGSSELTHQALRGGGLDMYPEYVGVLLSEIASVRSRPGDSHAAYRLAQRFERRAGFTLLAMTPFSDANAIAVKPTFAAANHLRSLADLRRVRGGVRIGAPPEFRTRFEGLVGLGAVYGVRDATAVRKAIGQQYQALDTGEVDAAAVFTTDGQLARHAYRLLGDPRGLFGEQPVAPIISRRVLRARGPRLAAAIDAVSATLTTAAMRRMNAAVDLLGQRPHAVAARFLRAHGLL